MRERHDLVERDRRAFKIARQFLLRLDNRITPKLLGKYLQPRPRPKLLSEIYCRILHSAKNANMKGGVIDGGIGSVDNLAPVLYNFEPRVVLKSYSAWEPLMNAIVGELKPRGKLRRAPQSIWPQFCRTILSAARFLSGFASANDFYEWADMFDFDDRARPALPLIIAHHVEGIGFALACDLIKELGFPSYGKPDVQIIELFLGLGLSQSDDQYSVLLDIFRVAKHNRKTPYAVDKTFWLIGSGRFYQDGLDIGGHKKEFLRVARKELLRD